MFIVKQNEVARAEAATICNNDNQYIVPTSGTPLRGLIQDHVAGGVKLTQRDTFLSKEDFQQLLFVAISGLPGTEVVSPNDEIVVPSPAILKPKPMWTGKQVISSLIHHLCKPPLPPLHLDGKARTPPQAFGASNNEHVIVFRYGELLCGVMDKAAVGNTSMSIVHAIYELYGAELAGKLLTAFGRLFTYYLQAFAAMSCGIEDLTLRPSAEKERSHLLTKVGSAARVGLLSFLRNNDIHHGGDSGSGEIKKEDLTPEESMESAELLGNLLLSEPRTGKPKIDAHLQSVVNKVASDVIKACLPNGLESMFPKNNFSMMVSTGAKGSAVNQSQISCFLGQQALEGQRVPIMISGKTLPSFRAYDGTARAGGFISDRFLTGVKPQEYYFHCMAGREGLVDTAVKTSRSGYLQRCLVKHLEELQVNYDYTVRDSGGNVIQFLYGEDGLDTLTASMLGGSGAQMQFLARNHQALLHKYGINEGFLEQGMDTESADAHRRLLRNGDKFAKVVAKVEKKGGAGYKLAPAGAAIEEALAKKCVVLARRKVNPELGWSRANMQHSWSAAEIVKVRKAEDGSSHVAVDLKYGDGVVEKKVPLFIRVKNKGNHGPIKVEHVGDSECTFEITPLLDDKGVFMPLIRAGLPDPAMSTLPLGNTVGAISEKLQKDIDDYINKNPDKAISDEVSDTTVTAKALEFLVSVKYMRGLACPGEAVGCVAAQSIGEPSTQMTLNTFHLAGHGGANVTLGIPRLREIIMTASKTLKTPTMMLPLLDGKTMNEAKEISRKLSKLCMNELLHHKKGVEVRESIKQGDAGSWLRHYRVRFYFESPAKIFLAFGIKFDDIVDCMKHKLLSVLRALINREIRRSGDKNRTANLVGSFKEKASLSRGTGDNDEAEGDGEERRGPKSGDGLDEDGGSEEDEEDADDDSVDGAEALKVEKGGKKAGGDAVEYEEDEDGDEEDSAVNNEDNVSEGGSGDEGSNSDEDAPKAVKKRVDKKTHVAETPQKTNPKSKSSAKSPSVETSDKKKRGPVVVNEKDFTWSEEQGWVEMDLRFLASARRLLMLQLAEQAAKMSPIRITKNINRAHVVHCDNEAGVAEAGLGIMTEGVNFEEAWSLPDDLIRHSDIRSNDINAMLMMYGVEAARESIVSEVKGVFGVYGINVSPRHLGLIADFMTRNGEYTPMNRAGMWYCPSPLQQMSFETTCTFLTQAAQDGGRDVLESPSARIVTGSAPRVGTGCFELLFPMS
jgi:DNA-directed RNA polymerase I subunit RPA1